LAREEPSLSCLPVRLGSVLTLAAAVAGSLALVVPAASPAPPAGYKTIMSGTATGGAHWELAARRTKLSGLAGLCLVLDVEPPNGFGVQVKHCAAGSISKAKVEPVAIGPGSDADVFIVGGFAVAQARKATITFADGKRLTVATRRGPPGWRRALGTKIRFFAADGLRVTTSPARRVAIYDARGRRIGRVKLGP
jgi:hypothetical protein